MEAQTAQFQASLDKANKKLGRFEKDTKRAIGGIQRSFTQLRRTATGFAAAFAAAVLNCITPSSIGSSRRFLRSVK